jgi:HD-GYP domain-containing protein (c-di-GMP phosphodiesterase class II)
MDQLARAITVALDIVEGELLGASTHHGKRIAVLSAAMGRFFGMDDSAISALTTCALFHDSALTEYILAEFHGHDPAMQMHCLYGQRNAESLLHNQDIRGFILYHHERADGNGPFGRKQDQYPLGAEIIAAADMLDVSQHLQRILPSGLEDIRKRISREAGVVFTERTAEALLSVLDKNMLARLQDDQIFETTEQAIPVWITDVEDEAIFQIAALTAHIIDYKSRFTKNHSVQISNRSWLMSGYYNYDMPLRAQIYLAAALHDIGKLATPATILEKAGKLSDEEFTIIKDHVRYTEEILTGVTGLESICDLAIKHHEKLDGSGYHRGKKADELDFNARLLACLDIYQAITEARPYHGRRSHAETISILRDMSDKGLIDKAISRDLDTVMAEYSNRDVPPPPGYMRLA